MKRARKNYNSGLGEGELRRLRQFIESYTETVARVERTLREIVEERRKLIEEEKELRSKYTKAHGYNPEFQDEHE